MVSNPFHQQDPGFRRLYVFGAGGFGREVAWLAAQCWGERVQVQFLVDIPEYLQGVNGLECFLLSEVKPDPSARYVVAVGDPSSRRRIAGSCDSAGLRSTRMVHPRAETSRWMDIGDGTVICAGVIATTNIQIGSHVHLNLDCTIGHDVVIGDFSTLSPGVHVSGHVHIGQGVFIGTGANILPGSADKPLVIADGAVVAAGACVITSVEPGALVAGVPAIRKR